jgi:hypothetical protein
LKIKPSKSNEDFRNLVPIQKSKLIALVTSSLFDSIYSQREEMELIEEKHCAKTSLEINLESSQNQTFLCRMTSNLGNQCKWIEERASLAAIPEIVLSH